MSSPAYTFLPNKDLDHGSELSNQFRDHGCETYHQACDHVWRIPYGRNSNSSDWSLVLSENVGTCSTKHALLKSLANEIGLEIDLVLGIYPMNESNTPGIGSVLTASSLDYIPEAHCYLSYGGVRIDLTKFSVNPAQHVLEFFTERKLEPTDIGETKRQIHKQFLADQYGENEAERIWNAREECISALCT